MSIIFLLMIFGIILVIIIAIVSSNKKKTNMAEMGIYTQPSTIKPTEKYCDKCGAKLKSENVKFCDQCGAEV